MLSSDKYVYGGGGGGGGGRMIEKKKDASILLVNLKKMYTFIPFAIILPFKLLITMNYRIY
jgi:hypothetical protein